MNRVRTKAGVELWSRNKRDFFRRFPKVVRALEALLIETVLDGETVAVNGDEQPIVSSLQNFRDGAAAIFFCAFDATMLAGADSRSKPLATLVSNEPATLCAVPVKPVLQSVR